MTRQKYLFVGLIATLVSGVLMFVCATIATAQTENVLHAFQSAGPTDGANPDGGLVSDSNGSLYGATQYGGPYGPYGYGTVYKLSPPATRGGAWKYSILHTFTGGADGGNPSGNLLVDRKSHKVYGTTQYGGAGYGVVYELAPGKSWTETVLYTFNWSDGGVPYGGVVFCSHSAVCGTTDLGGQYGSGVVFRLTPPAQSGGTWSQSILYNFKGGADGSQPQASLILDSVGALYGTTEHGGTGCESFGCGTVFKLSPPTVRGHPWTEMVLYAFTGGSDGANPRSSLIFDSNGVLYGTAFYQGQYGWGVVFMLTPSASIGSAWTESVLHSFAGGVDGGFPVAGLISDQTGVLYGTTEYGGDVGCNIGLGCGVVFKLIPPTPGDGWSEQILHSFSGEDGVDGAFSFAPLLELGTDLYGTTYSGGDAGTLFEITP